MNEVELKEADEVFRTYIHIRTQVLNQLRKIWVLVVPIKYVGIVVHFKDNNKPQKVV